MTIDTLWYTRCPSPTAASVAIRQGWLEQEFVPDGIAVRSLASSTDKSVHLSHYQHTQPNSFRFGGPVPPLVSRSRGTDVRLIGLGWTDRSAGIYALPSSGIAAAADLRGKRLGVPRRLNDSIDWWRAQVLGGFKAALDKAGIPADDVSFVDIDVEREFVADASPGAQAGKSLWGAQSQFAVQREEIAALYRGEVDVLYSSAALGALLQAFTGARPVVDLSVRIEDEIGGQAGGSLLTVSGALLDERPDLVERWLLRLLDAQAWAAANEADAKRIVGQDSGLPEDFVDAGYSPRIHTQFAVAFDPDRIAGVKARHDELLGKGFLAAPIDFDAFIDQRPLEAARARHAQRSKAA